MSLIPPHLVLVTDKRFGNGWLSVILDGNLYVSVPEHDRDSWLILRFGRVEGQESSATILPQVTG